MNKDLLQFRAQLKSFIDLISSVVGDGIFDDEERSLLLDYEIFLSNLVTAINNQILRSQDAAINSLIAKFKGSASELDDIHEKIQKLTKALKLSQTVVGQLGSLIQKIQGRA